MADETKTTSAIPTLEDWQHWTWVMGRAQQMLMEAWADGLKKGDGFKGWGSVPGLMGPSAFDFGMPAFGAGTPGQGGPGGPGGSAAPTDPMAMMAAGAQAWAKGLEAWTKVLAGTGTQGGEKEVRDRRFSAPEWRENPLFDQIRRTYLAISEQMLGSVDKIEGVDEETRAKLRFAVRNFVDAMSPSNFALTNPQVLKRTIETRGENLLKGLANMLKDIAASP